MGTLTFVGAVPSTCPVNSCATAGYYYLYDGHEGLGLVPLSTVAADACDVILAGMNAGATPAGGSFTGEWVASNQFPSLILPIDGGLTGAYPSGCEL